MHLAEGHIYHVYNRGNNKRPVFLVEEHYFHFLRLVNKTIIPYCDLLAWCLMPNHFHFLIAANETSVQTISDGSFPRQRFSQQIKQLLSSYTKAVCVNADPNYSYGLTAFHYIHQNPMRAGLVKKMEDWEFSSFKDYLGLRAGKLCNIPLATTLLDHNVKHLYKESYSIIKDDVLNNIVDRAFL